MSTKSEVLLNPSSCLNKAEGDEPVFVLRAKDPLAPMIVRMWAELAYQLNAHESKKIQDAYGEARDMVQWRAKMYGAPRIDWGG